MIVSLSGVRAETLGPARAFAAELDRRAVPLSLLVAPRRKSGYRLTADAVAQHWLRHRREQGDAVVLHGYDQAAVRKRRAEFAVLAQHEALLRLTAADRVLEQVGLRTRLFVPPQWTISAGALAALPQAGFRLCADRGAVRALPAGPTTWSRVLGVGGGTTTEPWRCRALVLAADRTARRGGVLRLAAKAAQLDSSGPRQALLDALDLALHHGADPVTYATCTPGAARSGAA